MEPDPHDRARSRSGDITAKNVRAGRDVTQITNAVHNPTDAAQKFPVTEKSSRDSWLQFFVFLLTNYPIRVSHLNSVFRASFALSLIVLLGTLTAVIPNYTPIFSAGYPLAPSVFFPIILSASLVIYVSREYFLTRESSTCPDCNSPFSLRTTDLYEFPHYSTDSHRRGERTVECTHCAYEATENVTWTSSPTAPPTKP